ncbi:hypothetical protein COE78_07540 [Bacillus pseudomycoides]|nr:hypothetical protein COE78_07540 [Bacillus pseudomycoides]PHC78897.1 hypothetical protein COF38_03840 [Bacillus pseudomycoides]
MANLVTNESPKTYTMIGMYKKLHGLIERKKVGFLMRVGNSLVFATDNETLCQPIMYRIYKQTFITNHFFQWYN